MYADLIAQIQQTTDSIRQVLEQVSSTGPTAPQDTITIWKLISYGGWGIMGPLFLMSLITVYILIDRLLALRRAMHEDRDFMNKLRDYMHSGKTDSARALCSSSNTAISRIIEKGLQRLDKPVKEIELAMESVGKQEVFKLEKGMGFLTLVAKLAPMFGFIGTIIGVIKIFYDISLTDNISIGVISGGLYQKMVTSAAGLIVGIAAFICYYVVNTMVNRAVAKMETASLDFIDLLHEPAK